VSEPISNSRPGRCAAAPGAGRGSGPGRWRCRWSVSRRWPRIFWFRLGDGDPSKIPSALIGHPAPARCCAAAGGPARQWRAGTGLDPAALRGKVSIVNVWASWCVPCHDEAPLLSVLGRDKRLQMVGINYKDAPTMPALSRPLRAIRSAWWASTARPRGDRMGCLWRAGNLHCRAQWRILYKMVGPSRRTISI